MTVQLTPEARARLDAHLDAVEAALAAAGRTREHRRGVVDDLEAQALDMLSRRSERPTVGDVEEVLRTMDPPTAFGEGMSGAAPGGAGAAAVVPGKAAGAAVRPRYSRAAVWGFVCIVLSVVPLPVLFVVGFFWMSAAPSSRAPQEVFTAPPQAVNLDPPGYRRVEIQPAVATAASSPAPPADTETHRFNKLFSLAPCIGIILFPLGIVGTVLGWVAFGSIVRSKGAVRGLGLALFDGLFYPVIVLAFLIMTLVGG